MRRQTIEAARAHAEAEYPRECCGLAVMVAGRERYWPCENKSTDGDHFVMDKHDLAAAEDAGEIVAVVHSHPDYPAKPSEADRVACEASGVPWYIIEVRKADDGTVAAGDVRGFVPEGYRAPLIGRQFAHGVLDCYTLIRDWYQRERGISLPDFERTDDWWNRGDDLYMRHYAAAGFRPLAPGEAIATGDVIVMQVRAPQANHAGVYLGAAGLKEAPGLHPVADAMLHHLYGRLSERVVYGGHWAELTRTVLRHG